MKKGRRAKKRFSRATLFTIVIGGVLAGILFLIGFPMLLRARASANEAEAIGDTRTVMSAEQTFLSVNCGLFADVTDLCREGPDCQGIRLEGYEGPEFLPGDLGRKSPYTKSGYERNWMPNGSPGKAPAECTPTPTAALGLLLHLHPG